MIDSITRITLNLQETNTMVSIRAKRGDTGRKLLIHLSDGSIPYHISDDCYATFTAKKPDGTKINNACTIENNVIEYEFTDQTCTAVGTMKAEIKLYGADRKLITSACFLVNVYDTVFRDGDEVVSEGEMNALDDLILRANAFLNETGKLLRWQGNWDSETEYEANDLVLHEEVLYVAEEAITAGTAPGSEEVTAWVPIAGMGTGSGADLTEQVDRAEAAAQNAESAAATANNARAQAQAAANSAGAYVGNAVAAMNNANAAAATAESAKESVSTSVNLAGGYASTAHSSANQAEQAKNSAQGYASSASSSATRAEEAAARAEEAAAEAGNGSGGNVEEHNTDPTAHADIRKHLTAANIVETASGNVIVLEDAAGFDLRIEKLYGKTTQNGTPTPEAPVALESVGDGGYVNVSISNKNMLGFPYRALTEFGAQYVSPGGVTFTTNDDGSITFNGTNTADASNKAEYLIVDNKNNKLWLPVGTYTLSTGVEPFTDNRFWYVMVGMYSGSIGPSIYVKGGKATFKVIEPGYLFLVIRLYDGKTADNITVYPKLEKGTIATEYEKPIAHQTAVISTPNGLPGIPVASGGNYTDENGQQWICDEVNFTKGVYVQRMKKVVFDGSEDEDWQAGTSSAQEGKYRKRIDVEDKLIFESNTAEPMLCDRYPITVNGTTGNAYNCITSFAGASNQNRVYFYDEAMPGSNEAEWRAYLSEHPVALMYVLATPAETALSEEELTAFSALHTNYPNTTVFNDGGAGMEVEYVADTKLYVDKKFAELSVALLNQ